MPITNPKKFGLGVQNKLGDLKNPATALKALGISGNDLSIIYNSRSGNPKTPISFNDVRGFSRLSQPLWETLDRYYYESSAYADILPRRAGIDSILFGGLKIQGQLSGSASRYRYIDGYGTGRIGTITDNSASNGPYPQGEWNNLYAAQAVTFTVTKDSNETSTITIFGTTYSTASTGTFGKTFVLHTPYQLSRSANSTGLQVQANGRRIGLEDEGGTDFDDLQITTNIGRFYEQNGNYFFIIDTPGDITGDGKATFNVRTLVNNGTPSVFLGNRGNGYSTGNTLTLMANQVGAGFDGSKDITITVSTIHTSDKIADISTSRVSAWSSADPRATNTNLSIQALARISYGARIGLRDNSYLKFGQTVGYQYPQDPDDTNSSNLVKLQTTIVPTTKLFNIPNSPEIPTSKIQCKINGRDVHLYAMKGIPVVFRGFFRKLNAAITINTITLNGVNIVPCWRIIRTENTEQSKYTNASSIYYAASISRERNIEIYYSPDNITSISIPSANIDELPIAKFKNLSSLDLNSNQIKNFPDINQLVPIKTDEGRNTTTLSILNLSYNPLYLSETSDERRLNGKIVDKIPNSIQNLNLAGTFYGEIPLTYTPGAGADNANVGTGIKIFSKFIYLNTLNLSRGGGPHFHLENTSSTCPEVTESCVNYNIASNDFRTLTNVNGDNTGWSNFPLNKPWNADVVKVYSWQNLPALKTLSVQGNYYLTAPSGFESQGLTSNDIESFYISSTGIPLPQLRNKPELKTIEAYWNRTGSTFFESGTYKFSGCTKLENLHLYGGNITGEWPVFTNPQLKIIDLRYTNITGGGGRTDALPGGYSASTYAIPPNILEDYSELENFWFISSSVASGSGLGYELFESCVSLQYFNIYCYGRLSGGIPNLSGLGNLRYAYAYWNGLTGTLPSFAGSNSIYGVQLQGNKFTGSIPSYTNLTSLRFLYVHNNELDGTIGEFVNCNNLYYFYAHNNRLVGALPDFSGAPNLRYIILFNNNLTGYIGGALTGVLRMNYLDLSNNDFVQSALNQLIDDLYTNYQTSPRGGVTINLKNIRNNGVLVIPSEEQLDKVDQLRNAGWNVKLD